MFLLAPLFANAQHQNVLDSLYKILPQSRDSAKADILYGIARFEFDRDAAKALTYSYRARRQAKIAHYRHGEVMSLKQLGVFYNFHKNHMDSAKLFLDSALALSRTLAERNSVHTALGSWYSRQGNFEKSQEHLLLALENLPSKTGNEAINTYNTLAVNLSFMGRHREATQYYKKNVAVARHLNSPRHIGLSLSNLGLSYVNMEETDSALTVFKELYAFEIQHGNPLMNATLMNELGKIYFQNHNDDSAYYFMHTGLRAAKTSGLSYSISRSLSNLARYHLDHHPDSALFYARQLRNVIDNSSDLAMEDLNYILAEAHGHRGRFDSAFHYFDRYIKYHDAVFQEKQIRRIAELEAQYKVKVKQAEIERLEGLRKSEVFKKDALAIGLILSISVSLLIFLNLRARIRARKREIEVKNWQLENFTRSMIEKSELAEELRTQLERINAEISLPNERIENVSQILNSSILTEEDWEKFKSLFLQVNPTFFAELKIKHAHLTQSEIRLAALIKLRLSTKEIANMLGISAESANKARYRLRKKLDLNPEQDLEQFIESVSPGKQTISSKVSQL